MLRLSAVQGQEKTTLCSLIPRFYDVSSGEVKIDGINVRDIKLERPAAADRDRTAGCLSVRGTVMDNIRYGKPDASDEEVIRAARAANAHEFISELVDGYDTDIDSAESNFPADRSRGLRLQEYSLKKSSDPYL